MKKMHVLLLVLLLLMLLPNLAAAEQTIEIHEFVVCESGQMRLPVYPDWSDKIGEGLTKNDFVITYESSSPYVTVEPDGTLYISKEVPMLTNMPLEVTYTPKVEGVGEKTVFQCRLRTVEPVTQMVPEKAFYRVRQGEQVITKVDLGGAYYTMIASVVSDSPAVKAEIYVNGDRNLQLRLTAVQGGTANVVITALNGMQATITMDVVGEPSQFKFAAERFTCHPGETIDLGLDTGNGPYGLDYYYSYGCSITRDGQYAGNGSFDTFTGNFRAGDSGEYHIICSWKTVKGEVWVNVVDRNNCTDIALSTDDLYLDRAAKLLMYDEYGQEIYQRFAITRGAELVNVVGRTITANAPGTVEITVYNTDGSTVSRSFEVMQNPTQMFVNAREVELKVGETFDLEVTFDQGSLEHYCTIYDALTDAYGQTVASVIGDRIYARRPGTTTVYVYAGNFQELVEVRVKDSDKRLRMIHPEGEIGIGHSFQLQVADKTGKVYPATFFIDHPAPAVSVTADGLMTGVAVGTCRVYAQLESGLRLYYLQEVVKIPNWLYHDDVELLLNTQYPSLGPTESDLGVIDHVHFTIEDESIASVTGGFKLLKPGVTNVTVTADRGGAQYTFKLTVLPPDDALYIIANGQTYTKDRSYGISIAKGYSKTLPDVVNYYGEKVKVTWKITDSVRCDSHKYNVGYNLSGNTVKSICHECRCTVTATSATGSTIEVDITSFRLASAIGFSDGGNTIEVGQTLTKTAVVDMFGGQGYRLGDITWTVRDPSILEITDVDQNSKRATVKGLKEGKTTLTAKLQNGVNASIQITVTASSRVPGDVLNNGGVTIEDVIALLEYSQPINLSNADVNADGKADIHDALIIMQYIAGWNVTLK